MNAGTTYSVLVKQRRTPLRSELKMKTMLLEKLEADVNKARYANFQEV